MEKGMYQLPHSIDTAGPAQQLSVFSNFPLSALTCGLFTQQKCPAQCYCH